MNIWIYTFDFYVKQETKSKGGNPVFGHKGLLWTVSSVLSLFPVEAENPTKDFDEMGNTSTSFICHTRLEWALQNGELICIPRKDAKESTQILFRNHA